MNHITEAYSLEFARGLRSVPGYVDLLCGTCRGACGERPDDQCLISAWSSYIRAAAEEGHPAYEAGWRCAVASLRGLKDQQKLFEDKQLPALPCQLSSSS